MNPPLRPDRALVAALALASAAALGGCAARAAQGTATRPAQAPASVAAPTPSVPETARPEPEPAGNLALPAPPPSPAARDLPAPDLAPATTDSRTPIARELDVIFDAPSLATAVVGALVQSLDTGEVLYRRNPHTLLVPASNEKVVTMAVGAARLGWDYRYETRLESAGPQRADVLDGDLFVVGAGDPTMNARAGDRLAVFHQWVAALRAAGIRRIAGRIVGDDDAFEDEPFGEGWSWDDLPFAYAAPVGALQFNENLVEVAIRPGAAAGDPASAILRSAESDIRLGIVAVTTVPAGGKTDIEMSRLPGEAYLGLAGTIALGRGEVVVRAAVANPTLYFVTAFRTLLVAEGIAVDGQAVDIDEVADAVSLKASATRRRLILAHRSPPLSEIGKTLMKVSQNLYAETVFRTLSRSPGPGSVDASRTVVSETLQGWGIASGEAAIVDGSGLSRLNLLSAATLVRILRVMAADPAMREAFEDTFPVAGRDGTLAGRLKATRAESNARAKTGTLTRVRALAGYLHTLDGERLAFAILANNFTEASTVVDAVVDQAVERLANLRR